ncbi:hypothetical protein LEMLEM_LOCUS27697, partial [Lemmus lemmus]
MGRQPGPGWRLWLPSHDKNTSPPPGRVRRHSEGKPGDVADDARWLK